MRAEKPDNRIEVPWRKAVSVKRLFELYSLACAELEHAGRIPQLERMRQLIKDNSKSQEQTLKIMQEFVRFG